MRNIFVICKILKAFKSFRYKERRWDLKQLVGSGGMPSSHSATVVSLAVAVGLQEGFGGSLFALAFILACVVRSLLIVCGIILPF